MGLACLTCVLSGCQGPLYHAYMFALYDDEDDWVTEENVAAVKEESMLVNSTLR